MTATCLETACLLTPQVSAVCTAVLVQVQAVYNVQWNVSDQAFKCRTAQEPAVCTQHCFCWTHCYCHTSIEVLALYSNMLATWGSESSQCTHNEACPGPLTYQREHHACSSCELHFDWAHEAQWQYDGLIGNPLTFMRTRASPFNSILAVLVGH